MTNILITNDCPRNCTFCFAKSRLGGRSEGDIMQFMSRADLRKVMDFLERSGEMNLRLLGGEPTRHPEFKEMVQEAIDRDFQVQIFSNLMMPQETADFLASPNIINRIAFLANVSLQPDDEPADKEKVAYALEKIGTRVHVGITITSPEFEYDYLIRMIDQYKLKRRIRIGIAQPIVGEKNSYLAPQEYRKAGKAIVAMAEECVKHDILIGFDCGMTLCMFSEQELGKLQLKSEGLRIVCEPIIDFGPELDIWHCFPLSEIWNSHLQGFKNRNEIVRFYREKVARYKTFGCREECLSCIYLKRGQCHGGCLAHALNSLNKLPPRKA